VDVKLRAPLEEEAAAIADVLNAHSQELWGVDAMSTEEMEHWFSIPTLDPAEDMRIAVAPGGDLLGYADVNDGGPERRRFWIDMRLAPGAERPVGDALVEAMEARARERAAPGALARGIVAGPDEPAQQVFARRGYALIRHSLRMERSLEDEPEEPAWPEGFALRTATDDELRKVWAAVEDGFADHWEFEPQTYEEWLHWAEGPGQTDRSLWFLAEAGEEIAGACLSRPHESGEQDAGYVASLSVRPPWRRRGLALAMLLHSFREFRRRGRTRVTLGVDAENTTGAVRLYERAGMRIARRYDLVDKPLG
jgi:ribosomal protein S18 acetylase RimI-like enzyme